MLFESSNAQRIPFPRSELMLKSTQIVQNMLKLGKKM